MSGIGNSQTLTILIERQLDGEYAAIDEANHDNERGLIEDHSQLVVLRDK